MCRNLWQDMSYILLVDNTLHPITKSIYHVTDFQEYNTCISTMFRVETNDIVQLKYILL